MSTRKRKDADQFEIKVQVCVYMFDLLYLNDKPLVTEPFIIRRKLLKDNFQEIEGQFKFATSIDTNDVDEVQAFLDESIKGLLIFHLWKKEIFNLFDFSSFFFSP